MVFVSFAVYLMFLGHGVDLSVGCQPYNHPRNGVGFLCPSAEAEELTPEPKAQTRPARTVRPAPVRSRRR